MFVCTFVFKVPACTSFLLIRAILGITLVLHVLRLSYFNRGFEFVTRATVLSASKLDF